MRRYPVEKNSQSIRKVIQIICMCNKWLFAINALVLLMSSEGFGGQLKTAFLVLSSCTNQ